MADLLLVVVCVSWVLFVFIALGDQHGKSS